MADLNTTQIDPDGIYYRRERLAGAAGIKPGHILDVNASDQVINFATAESVPQVIRVASVSVGDAGDMTREYASGEVVNFHEMPNGTKVTVVVAASQTIVKNDEITTSTGGEVKKPAVAGTGVFARANGAVTTGAGETAFLSVTLVNN